MRSHNVRRRLRDPSENRLLSHATTDDWRFEQPPDFGVITLHEIADGSQPVSRVRRDLDERGWQFLTLETARMEDATVVCFSNW